MAEVLNPLAGPSGPGKFATRTDNLQLGSTAYGEGIETSAIKAGAKLSTTPDASRVSTAGPTPAPRGVGLFEQSQRPNEDISSGIDIGPGVGSSALMMSKSSVKLSDTLVAMLPFDNTGEIAILYQEALSRGD